MNAQTELVPVSREQNISTLKQVADDLEVSITGEAKAELAILQERYPTSAIPADLSDKKNYKFVHNTIQAINKPKFSLENSRKEVVKPLNDTTKKVNAAAKPLKEAYEELATPWKKAKKDFDIAEEIRIRKAADDEDARVININTTIADIKAIPGSMIRSNSVEIGIALVKAEKTHGETDYMEFSEQGLSGYTEAVELLNEMYNQKVKAEELEAEAEARETKEAEEKAKREAEDKARVEKQRLENEAVQKKLDDQQKEIDDQKAELAKAAKEKAEREERDRIKKANKAAADIEEKRLEEERIKQEEERRLLKIKEAKEEEVKAAEALKRRATNIKEAVADMNNCGGSLSDSIIHDIIDGKIRHLQFID